MNTDTPSESLTRGKTLVERSTKCLQHILNLFPCYSHSDQVHPEAEHENYWEGFYAACFAFTTPLILGEIQRGTHDVIITHINEPASDFLGYDRAPYDDDHPNGILGRSVKGLMPDNKRESHEGYVSHWLRGRRGRHAFGSNSQDNAQQSPSNSSSYTMSFNAPPPVVNTTRLVEIKHADGSIKQVNATLSFFSPLGRGHKVVGMFVFDTNIQPPTEFTPTELFSAQPPSAS